MVGVCAAMFSIHARAQDCPSGDILARTSTTDVLKGLRTKLEAIATTKKEAYDIIAIANAQLNTKFMGSEITPHPMPTMTPEESNSYKVEGVENVNCWHYDPNDAYPYLTQLQKRLKDEENEMNDALVRLRVMIEDINASSP